MLINKNSSPGEHREAENVIRNTLEHHVELDTVAYNTFIKAMLEAGSYGPLQLLVNTHE